MDQPTWWWIVDSLMFGVAAGAAVVSAGLVIYVIRVPLKEEREQRKLERERRKTELDENLSKKRAALNEANYYLNELQDELGSVAAAKEILSRSGRPAALSVFFQKASSLRKAAYKLQANDPCLFSLWRDMGALEMVSFFYGVTDFLHAVLKDPNKIATHRDYLDGLNYIKDTLGPELDRTFLYRAFKGPVTKKLEEYGQQFENPEKKKQMLQQKKELILSNREKTMDLRELLGTNIR